MTANFKRILVYAASFLLSGILLYLALRGVDVGELKGALQNASYIWTIPLVIIILASHAIRAWRWQILLEALPDRQRTGDLEKVSFKTAFLSVMIGYFVNFMAPRLGEVVRAANVSRQEGFRFSGVFGTVVVERIIDVLVLGLGVLSLSVLFYEQFVFLQDRIFSPVISSNDGLPAWWALAGLMGVGMVSYLAFKTINTSQMPRIMQIRRRLVSFIKSFRDGILTVLKAPRRLELIGSTLLMWFLYTVMSYIPLVMLDMQNVYELTFVDAWSLMIFGAIGIAVPSPGGTGSYHYITKLALVNLFFVDEATAIIFAVLAHGIHLIVYIIAGVLALFIQGTSLQTLRSTAVQTD